MSKPGMLGLIGFLLIGLAAVSQGHWQAGGVAFGLAFWRIALDWMEGNGKFQSCCDINQYRVDDNGGDPERDLRRRFGPVMVVVVLVWTIAVLIIGDVVLKAPSWAVTVAIVSVIQSLSWPRWSWCIACLRASGRPGWGLLPRSTSDSARSSPKEQPWSCCQFGDEGPSGPARARRAVFGLTPPRYAPVAPWCG